MFWNRAIGFLYRLTKEFPRSTEDILDAVIWPNVALLSIILLVKYLKISIGGAYFVTVGIVVWIVLYQMIISMGHGVLHPAWGKYIRDILVAPIGRYEFICGNGLWALARGIIVFIYVISVASFFGINFLSLKLHFLILVLSNILVIGFLFGLIFYTIFFFVGWRAEALAWHSADILMLFSGVYWSIHILPTPLRIIGWASPVMYLLTAFRALFNHNYQLFYNYSIISWIMTFLYILIIFYLLGLAIKFTKRSGKLAEFS